MSNWLDMLEQVVKQQQQAERIEQRKQQREDKRRLHDQNQTKRRKPRKPKCGARTRRGTACIRKALANGRCPNHGGLSTGPKTKAGKRRIAAAQKKRWANFAERQLKVVER
jgi:hypothetical protein